MLNINTFEGSLHRKGRPELCLAGFPLVEFGYVNCRFRATPFVFYILQKWIC